MPCPAKELGAIVPLNVAAILVAQAFLPVPQDGRCEMVRNEEAKERGVCGCWCGAIRCVFTLAQAGMLCY
jgi:hypothetical protein